MLCDHRIHNSTCQYECFVLNECGGRMFCFIYSLTFTPCVHWSIFCRSSWGQHQWSLGRRAGVCVWEPYVLENFWVVSSVGFVLDNYLWCILDQQGQCPWCCIDILGIVCWYVLWQSESWIPLDCECSVHNSHNCTCWYDECWWLIEVL